jgi:hypothetical protein
MQGSFLYYYNVCKTIYDILCTWEKGANCYLKADPVVAFKLMMKGAWHKKPHVSRSIDKKILGAALITGGSFYK